MTPPTARPLPFIPLVRADLTEADQEAFLRQIDKNPFHDSPLVERWESRWRDLWDRPCVAYATPSELLACLKKNRPWPDGLAIHTSPLLPPHWREALEENWLRPRPHDVTTASGQEQWPATAPSAVATNRPSPIRLLQHTFGLPAQAPAPTTDTGKSRQWGEDMEEISALLKPLPGHPKRAMQWMVLDGNRMIQGGGSCLLFADDQGLIEALKRDRQRPPSGPLCALGLSQLSRLEAQLTRREQLAHRYLDLRVREEILLPPATGPRRWETFVLRFHSRQKRLGLQQFLRKAGIGAAPPLWYPAAPPPIGREPAPRANNEHAPLLCLQERSLALPLYASLTDPAQKKIINRIHRWLERGGPTADSLDRP